MEMTNGGFGTVVNGVIVFAPYPIITLNDNVFTQDPVVYARYGYKPVARDAMPATVDGYEIVGVWVDDGACCRLTWTQVAKAEDGETTPDPRDAALEELGVSVYDESNA